MTIEERQRIEKNIVRLIFRHGIKLGYSFRVNDGGAVYPSAPSNKERELMPLCFSVDEEKLIAYKDGVRAGAIFLVYGNDGFDAVNDYTASLEPILELSNAYAEKCELKAF